MYMYIILSPEIVPVAGKLWEYLASTVKCIEATLYHIYCQLKTCTYSPTIASSDNQ